jgi:ATP-dependent helicase/nuclease subunit A
MGEGQEIPESMGTGGRPCEETQESMGTTVRLLTDEQEQAISRRQGSILLAAGAGSGKTSVLVERFVRAIREDGLTPGRILAITFTERAAGELRERVRASLLRLGERELAREAEAASVGTFHGFCARLLRIHPLQAGVEPGFQILEEGLADRLRALAFRDALARFLDGERPAAVDLVAAYGADPLRTIVLGAYAQLRSQGQADPRLPATSDSIPAYESIGELLDGFGLAYARRKHVRAALDFDDLELCARDLLAAHADIREAWSERFQLLMVDEFQDSNPRQLQVLAALDRDNLFTVGDELQSIYGFRHADVSLFRERNERLAARGASLALTHNFRSRPQILTAVRRIFAHRIGERFAPPIATRPHGPDEPIVELLLTDRRGWDAFPGDRALEGLPAATPWRQAEARLLASRIAELVADGQARAGEIVVLLRALGDLPVYESALRHHGLSTLAGVGGFWSHQQVGDLLSWLRALANPLDELALYSTLASPLAGVSSDGLASIARHARERGRGVWQVLSEPDPELGDVLPSSDRERVSTFREIFVAERAAAALHPISELLRRAIAHTGYDAHVLSLGWGERRLANIHKLVRLARQFEAREGRDLRGFLDHVAHVEEALGGREADAPVGDAQLDAVRLMSIHAAKGLEFPVVCVADLGRELNLRVPDLLVDGPSARAGLRLLELGNPEPSSALDYDALREERRAEQEQEEDRVLYVACTRAENRLLLSGSVSFERWPEPRPGVAPIAWLAPALLPDSPALAGSSQPPCGGLTLDVGEGLLVHCLFNTPSGAPPQHAREAPLGKGGADESVLGRVGAGQAPPRQDPIGGAPALSAGVEAAYVGDVGEQLAMSLSESEPPLPATPPPRARPGTPGLPGARPAPVTAAPASPAPASPAPFPSTGAPLVDPDATMSYTSLAELERCGYRYYLERVLHLSENRAAARASRGEGDDSDDGGAQARIRGTIVHMLLESIDFSRPRTPSGGDVTRVARLIGTSLDLAERDEIVALIATALASPPAQQLSAVSRPRREHPFAFALGPDEPLVTGVLDFIAEQPQGGSLIVDYKSDRLTDGVDLERLVRRDYAFQRLLYALAAIEHGAPSVEVAHWFLERPRQWVSARFVAGEQPRLREQLSIRLARARDRGFAVTDDPHRAICLTCPGRGGLCSWGETHTMSERSATLESGA